MPLEEPSCALLRCLAHWPSLPEASYLAALAEKIENWDALIALAQEHRVTPVLSLCLQKSHFPLLPRVQQHLEAEDRRNLVHNLASAAELVTLLNLFGQAGIPVMPFKGIALASTAWGGLANRPAGDLDLLLHEQNVQRAVQILEVRGYRIQTALRTDGSQLEPENHELTLQRDSDGLIVELRWQFDLVYGRFTRNLGIDWVWPRRRTATIAGEPVPDLSPEVALLVLCMHGSKHGWSRLVWIMDVARMLGISPGIDWNAMIREARHLGLARALALGMLLARQVAGASIPPAVLARFHADRTALMLAQHFSDRLFDDPGIGPAGLFPYSIQLLDFRDQLRLLPSLALLQPNERDRAVVALPRSLHALYYLIRPLRILRDRAAR